MADTSPSAEPRFRYDAFLSHNHQNKPAVRELKQHLKLAHLKVWFDEDELRPGMPWQGLLEDGIKASKSVVVAVGADGVGPWEDEEMQGALRLAVKDKRPVIPVLLPGAPTQPELPLFLGNRTWVDLRSGWSAEGMNLLQWGITGIKPKPASQSQEEFETEFVRRNVSKKTSPATLNQILPGAWQVQIFQPTGMVEQMRQELFPNGTFRGEEMTPMGVRVVEGQWQVNPFAQLVTMQGRQTCGFQMAPFAVMLQVSQFDWQQVVAMTNAGERVAWQRVGPPPQG